MSRNSGEAGFGDDDRLPWLETVEEDYREGLSIWRILLLILLALAVLAAILLGYWWYQKQHGLAGGNGELINAQEGDYKVADSEGGMKVEGVGSAATAAGEGDGGNATVNLGAAPEAPVEGRLAPRPAPVASAAAKATLVVPASGGKLEARAPGIVPVPIPAATPGAGSGALIQLGAFPDKAGADNAWNEMSKRFSYLAPLGKSVETGQKDGKTVYRLRVNAGSNGQAKDICSRLKVAGENCYVAN